MNKNDYPKVLLTCIDAWRNDVGANTLPTFFENWDPGKIAVVYTKSELPDTKACNTFFQIPENEILHTVFHPGKKCGRKVFNCEAGNSADETYISNENVKEEQKRYHFFRNHRLTIFYLIRDFIWSLGAWKSEQFNRFIEEFDADVMFIPIYPYAYMNRIQAYIAKKTGLRGVAYIADDNYSYWPEWYNPMFWVRRFFLRRSIDNVMQYCDELLVILPKLKKEYEKRYRIPINILTKGIDIQVKNVIPRTGELPLKMVYTGNLFIGRDKTLINTIKAIKKINQREVKLQLDIYSHIPLSNRLKKKLNVDGCVSFKGAVPISEVEKIQQEADIVLFVEGLDIFNRNKARLSFSTKLTDYFKSGKCIFAVGKKSIAPIEYMVENECAIVASTKKEIYTQLLSVVEEPSRINVYGEKAMKLGRDRHSRERMNSILYQALNQVSR